MASSSTPLRAPEGPRLPSIPRLPNGEEDTEALRRMVQAGIDSGEREGWLTDEEVFDELLKQYADLPDDE